MWPRWVSLSLSHFDCMRYHPFSLEISRITFQENICFSFTFICLFIVYVVGEGHAHALASVWMSEDNIESWFSSSTVCPGNGLRLAASALALCHLPCVAFCFEEIVERLVGSENFHSVHSLSPCLRDLWALYMAERLKSSYLLI